MKIKLGFPFFKLAKRNRMKIALAKQARRRMIAAEQENQRRMIAAEEENQRRMIAAEEKKQAEDDAENEMLRVYRSVIPTSAELDVRENVKTMVELIVKQRFQSADCVIYGSDAAGLLLKSSDFDMSINFTNKKVDKRSTLETLMSSLQEANEYENLMLKGARMKSCLHATHTHTGVNFDLTINNDKGQQSSRFIDSIVRNNEPVRQLIVLVKHFFEVKELYNTNMKKKLASVAICYMVIYFLQKKEYIPCFLNETQEIRSAPISLGVSKLLMEFFKFYLNVGLKKYAVSLRENQLILKSNLKFVGSERYSFSILDPFEKRNANVAEGMTKTGVTKMKIAFKVAYDKMKRGDVEKTFNAGTE